MTSPELEAAVRRVRLVNRYATPFAIFLVTLATFLPTPIRFARNLSIGLLIFSVAFNLATVRLICRRPEIMPKLKGLRTYVNLAVNVVLVYQLGPYWPPIWLLLALTPIATAIYASPKQSLTSSMLIGVCILGIHLVHGGASLVAWGQTVTRVAFVVFLSLLLNDMAREAGMNRS